MFIKLIVAAVLFFSTLSLVNAAEFYASPSGSSSGNGSKLQPWDLQTALNQPASVHPGDTIWLRGGIHRLSNRPTKFISRLAGASGLPITVRQSEGERATVDGNIMQTTGGWVNYWGFEIMNSQQFGNGISPSRVSSQSGSFPTTWYINYNGNTNDFVVSGFDLHAPNIKLINLVVHDNIGGGIGVNSAAGNTEFYGSLSYYNGWEGPDRGHGHGIYGQNQEPTVKHIEDCFAFGNFALGMQATGNGPGPVADNFYIEGNAFFLNGSLAATHQQNLLVGPFQGVAKNPVIRSNYIYDTMGSSSDFNLGNSAGAIVEGNYFQTSGMFASNASLTVVGNTFVSGTLGLDQCSYPSNSYLATPPTLNVVVVRPNKYELGRANIIVYNWENLNSVEVSVDQILPIDTPFEVRNAQDFYGPPVIQDLYTGGPLVLPMTGLTVAQPVGIAAPPASGPEFNAFVLVPLTNLGGGFSRKTTSQIKKVYLPVEAEAGTILPPMRIGAEAQSPGRRYVSSSSASKGSDTFAIKISVPGIYVIWGKVRSRSVSGDSFFVSVDDGEEDIFDDAGSKWSKTWEWRMVNNRADEKTMTLNPRKFNLSKGSHSIKFRARKANSTLDRIIISNDLGFVPREIIAVNEYFSAPVNLTTRFTHDQFLCHATNLFQDTLTFGIVSPYTSQRGTVIISGAEILYTPRPGFSGNDRFVYTLTSEHGDSSSAIAIVNVQPAAQKPGVTR
ncbi:MAG: hypothetical protein JWQ71_115 [Pedosphaera sp.]|nr:hypothetical protein [Pedosphaera sp.]